MAAILHDRIAYVGGCGNQMAQQKGTGRRLPLVRPARQRRQHAFQHFPPFLGPGVHANLIGQFLNSLN